MLLECSVVTEYVDAILLDERESLEDTAVFQFMQHYYPKVCYYHTSYRIDSTQYIIAAQNYATLATSLVAAIKS